MYTIYVDNSIFYISNTTFSKMTWLLNNEFVKINGENIYIDADSDSIKYIITLFRGYEADECSKYLRDKILMDIKRLKIDGIGMNGGNIDIDTINKINIEDQDTFHSLEDILDVTENEKMEFDNYIKDTMIKPSTDTTNIPVNLDTNIIYSNNKIDIDNFVNNIQQNLNKDDNQQYNQQFNTMNFLSTDTNIINYLKSIHPTNNNNTSSDSDEFINFDEPI